ncbi:MAG: thiamine pyrophosphate-binding protein [Opitutaceae bacterium]
MKLSDYVIDFVAAQGVRHVFMLPGGGAMHLNDSLGRHPGVSFVCNLHEQASAIAAEAYAQYTGNLGVAMVTTGPGGTNAVTGVAGAWLESTPMLFLSGQVKRPDLVGGRGVRQIGFQEIDIVSIVKPITKYAATVTDPALIRARLEEAVWHARNGRRGPVWIDLPLDVQASEIDPDSLEAFVPPAEAPNDLGAAAERCLEALARSRRPVVLAGNGVRHAGAISDLLRWAEMAGVPVLTTWKALDFLPEDHPLYAGRPGAVGQRGANFAQQTADLFISLGARLDFGQTAYNHGHFAPGAAKVIVDIDPHELAKLQMKIDVPVAGDAGRFLKELLGRTAGRRLPSFADWVGRCKAWKARYPVVLPAHRESSGGVSNYILVETLGQILAGSDVLVPGSSGACSEITCQALPVVHGGLRVLNTQGLGAMGFGPSAAIGACLASGLRRTICIDGDGGFAMNAQELATVARLKLPIKCFVLNNGGYGSIRATQTNYFDRRYMACDPGSGLTLPDLRKTAEACGVAYRRIASQEKLQAEIESALDGPGAVLCEVIMAPDQVTQPKVSSRQEADGRMTTMPMEDLWPFMDRAELEENLSV